MTESGATEATPVVGRFAPSPTGRMHAGNIYAALIAWLVAKSQGGHMVLRIEDLDRERSKSVYIDQIQRDFETLGLFWDEGPYFQHDRDEAYAEAFGRLEARGLLYPCFCTRADLHAASAPHRGEKLVYAGTCRHLSDAEVEARWAAGRTPGWRVAVDSRTIAFEDLVQGTYAQKLDRDCGDFLIRRSDGVYAYQLAVVTDDAEAGVTQIVRGRDLLSSTPRQIYLQRLLGLPTPEYYHVPLLVAPDGRRLSKREHDLDMGALRERCTPEELLGCLAQLSGLRPTAEPVTAGELAAVFSWNFAAKENITIGNPEKKSEWVCNL